MSVWYESHPGIIQNKTKVIIVYPTIDPDVVVVPIVSSIIIFPIVAFIIICCLRKRAAWVRKKARLAKRDQPYGERSCASMAQYSPPVSGSYSGGRRYTTIDLEMTTNVELVSPENSSAPGPGYS